MVFGPMKGMNGAGGGGTAIGGRGNGGAIGGG